MHSLPSIYNHDCTCEYIFVILAIDLTSYALTPYALYYIQKISL